MEKFSNEEVSLIASSLDFRANIEEVAGQKEKAKKLKDLANLIYINHIDIYYK